MLRHGVNLYMMSRMANGVMNNITPEQKAQMQQMGTQAVHTAGDLATTGISIIGKLIRIVICFIATCFVSFLLFTYVWASNKWGGGEQSPIAIAFFIFLIVGLLRKMIGRTFLPRFKKRNRIPRDRSPLYIDPRDIEVLDPEDIIY